MTGVATEVVLIGGRTIGRTLLDRLAIDPRFRVVAIIDDGLAVHAIDGVPVASFLSYEHPCRTAILALGMPEDKRFYRDKAANLGFRFISFIDQSALVGKSACIGNGSIVMPFASVVDGSRLGEFVYISFYSGVGKGGELGDYSTVMDHSSVRAAQIGDDVVLAGAVHIMEGAHVGRASWVAPGTILRNPMPPGQLIWGQSLRARHRARRPKDRIAPGA